MVRTWGRQGPHLRMLLRMKREELSQPPPQPLNLHPEGAPGPQTPSRQVADGENRPRRRPRAGRPHTQCPLTAPTAQPAIAAVACSAQACPSQHPRAPPKHRPQTHTLPNEPPPRGQAAPADVQPRAWVGSCSGLAGGRPVPSGHGEAEAAPHPPASPCRSAPDSTRRARPQRPEEKRLSTRRALGWMELPRRGIGSRKLRSRNRDSAQSRACRGAGQCHPGARPGGLRWETPTSPSPPARPRP